MVHLSLGESGSIITSRGDNSVISNEETIGGSHQESFQDYIGGTQESARFTKENSVAFERRTKEILGASRKRLVIGKNTLAYKTTVPDSSEAGVVYNVLKSIGVRRHGDGFFVNPILSIAFYSKFYCS